MSPITHIVTIKRIDGTKVRIRCDETHALTRIAAERVFGIKHVKCVRRGGHGR